MNADLHVHSRCSDGSAGLPAIIEYAKRASVDCLALCDHDSMMGVAKLERLGAAAGVQVIPGAELSAWDGARNRPVHLLCYLPADRAALARFCEATLRARREQKRKIVEKLSALYPIRWEDVLFRARESASVYANHIMSALMDMGYTNQVIGPLSKELISPGGSCYEDVRYPGVRETLAAVRGCGGVAVMAHPGQFDSLELAEELCAEGLLDGLELWHPRNTQPVQRRIGELAARYGLVCTGGSDFHGGFAGHPHPIGAARCGEEAVRRLLDLAREKGETRFL